MIEGSLRVDPRRALALGDLELSMNHQAVEVLKILASRPSRIGTMEHLSTHAFYGGRERGFLVTYKPNWTMREALHIFVAEHRVSDDIFIISWESEWMVGWDPPMIPDDIWKNSVYFKNGKFGEVADAVEAIIRVAQVQMR